MNYFCISAAPVIPSILRRTSRGSAYITRPNGKLNGYGRLSLSDSSALVMDLRGFQPDSRKNSYQSVTRNRNGAASSFLDQLLGGPRAPALSKSRIHKRN